MCATVVAHVIAIARAKWLCWWWWLWEACQSSKTYCGVMLLLQTHQHLSCCCMGSVVVECRSHGSHMLELLAPISDEQLPCHNNKKTV